jgi:hypothetical protein
MPSSVNRLFLIDSSFAKKSHLSRIQWFEELGQVMASAFDSLMRRGFDAGRELASTSAASPLDRNPPSHLRAVGSLTPAAAAAPTEVSLYSVMLRTISSRRA